MLYAKLSTCLGRAPGACKACRAPASGVGAPDAAQEAQPQEAEPRAVRRVVEQEGERQAAGPQAALRAAALAVPGAQVRVLPQEAERAVRPEREGKA